MVRFGSRRRHRCESTERPFRTIIGRRRVERPFCACVRSAIDLGLYRDFLIANGEGGNKCSAGGARKTTCSSIGERATVPMAIVLPGENGTTDSCDKFCPKFPYTDGRSKPLFGPDIQCDLQMSNNTCTYGLNLSWTNLSYQQFRAGVRQRRL